MVPTVYLPLPLGLQHLLGDREDGQVELLLAHLERECEEQEGEKKNNHKIRSLHGLTMHHPSPTDATRPGQPLVLILVQCRGQDKVL